MDAKIFGAFVARCRRKKNMTQAQLAAKLHVTDKAVSRWKRGSEAQKFITEKTQTI